MTWGPSVTPKLTPDSDSHSTSGAITNMPCPLPTPPADPFGDSQPKAQMLRCPLLLDLGDANWTDGMMQSIACWYIQQGFSISYTSFQNSVNSGAAWTGEGCSTARSFTPSLPKRLLHPSSSWVASSHQPENYVGGGVGGRDLY